ncbi:hypothetical protein [Methanobrevibacter sp.]
MIKVPFSYIGLTFKDLGDCPNITASLGQFWYARISQATNYRPGHHYS